MITLYRKNRLGVGSWRIWNNGNLIYIAHSTTVDGSEIIHCEDVLAGLAGRTLEEQVQSRINSRVNRQRDKGYVDTLDEAINKPLTNTLDQPPPMLAIKYDQMSSWAGQYVMQRKLDGFRCMITRHEGEIMAYTRGGKVLSAITHIIRAVELTLPDEIILDGEIYSHGVPLQTIASWAKRKQSKTESLVYHVYDSVSLQPFESRYEDARDAVRNADSEFLQMVENFEVTTRDEMWKLFAQFRGEGYEGGMLRSLTKPYESGTRSSGLIKVKAREDAEFKVIDVKPGSDGLGILTCIMESGKTFDTLAPGNHPTKRQILLEKEKYIGRYVTVEFANLTADGIPFHGVATRFKEEL